MLSALWVAEDFAATPARPTASSHSIGDGRLESLLDIRLDTWEVIDVINRWTHLPFHVPVSSLWTKSNED